MNKIVLPTNVLTEDEAKIILDWKTSEGGAYLKGVDFSTRFRVGGIPGMTDFPPVQSEYENFKWSDGSADSSNKTNPTSSSISPEVVRRELN